MVFSEYCEDFTSFVDTSSTLVTIHLYERLQLVEVVVEDDLVQYSKYNTVQYSTVQYTVPGICPT